MNDLTVDSLQYFLDRFLTFHDAVLRSCTVLLSTQSNTLSCDICIEAQDDESPSGWSTVTLRLHGLKVIHFDRRSSGIEVLSFGLQVFFLSDTVRVYLDPDPIHEAMLELHDSLAYVIGTSLEWKAEFYAL